MVLLTHIIIALVSVIFASYMLLSPSRKKLKTSYVLVGLTFASGTALVITTPAHMIHACISGVVYISAVMVMIAVTRRKLASITA